MIQRCADCGTWQWGPEWICHNCNSLDMTWERLSRRRHLQLGASLASVHPALKDHGPYLVVLVELPHAGNVRMIGNLLGDPHQEVVIGSKVKPCSSRTTTPTRPTHWCSGKSSTSAGIADDRHR